MAKHTTSKPIEQLTAKELAHLLGELKTHDAEVDRALAELKPPAEWPAGMPNTGPGVRFDPMQHAGTRIRVALESGSPEELLALEAERATLEAESRQLTFRIQAVTRRLPIAREEEARAAAPKRIKSNTAAAAKLVAQLQAVRAEYERLHGELLRTVDALVEDRARVPDADPMDVALFHDVGVALAYRLRRHVTETANIFGADTTSLHLFTSWQDAMVFAKRLLAPPQPSLLERVLRKLKTASSVFSEPRTVSDRDVEADLEDWWRIRLRLVTEGRFDEAESLEPTPPGRRESPRYAPQPRWASEAAGRVADATRAAVE